MHAMHQKQVLLLNFFIVGIRFLGVKAFVGPHQGNKGLCVAAVDQIMGIAGKHMHSLDVFAADREFQYLIAVKLSHLDQAMT